MAERIVVGESVVIAKNGSLETVATYYKGHLDLDRFPSFGGQHVMGWTGPETRVVSRKLMAHVVFVVERAETTEVASSDTKQEVVV